MRWHKLNVDWWTSEWVSVLSVGSRLVWVLILGYVKANGIRGKCKAIHPLLASRMWMVGEEDVRQLLMAAEKAHALHIVDGYWIVDNWAQYQTDETGAERQRRFKERQKQPESNGGNALLTEITQITVRGEERRRDKNNPLNPPRGTCRPELLEWESYAKEIGFPLEDARGAYDYYEANGWRQGGKAAIKDWKAACRQCARRRKPVLASSSKPDSAFLPGRDA